MARKPEIQYVHQFYVHGSEARVLEFKPRRRINKTTLPETAPDQRILISIDPVAVCGALVAVVMLVVMVIGVAQYAHARRDYQNACNQVIALQNENVRLHQKYEAGYNLEDIAKAAEALGMIPKDEAEVMYFAPVVPVREAEPTVWENIRWFIDGLFA